MCTTRWKALREQIGHGYGLELEHVDCRWLPLGDLREHPHRGRLFYESPALIGCALAVHRELYDDLRGFDPHMLSWGVEDLDFGLKCWLMGYPILHDPEALIAHRFRQKFDNFDVPVEMLVHNQLRMARKNFTDGVWRDWVERCRHRNAGRLTEHPEGLWAAVWDLFGERRPSVEQERAYLMARRVRDEFWYAQRFGLAWPRLQTQPFGAIQPMGAVQASPSPEPCKECEIRRISPPGENYILVGQKVTLSISCDEGTISDVLWNIPYVYVKDFKVWDGAADGDCPSGYCGKLYHLDTNDHKQPTITFYWVSKGEKKVTVSFKHTVDGVTKQCTGEITLLVVSPPVQTTRPADANDIGQPTVLPAQPHRVALHTAGGEPGMTFAARVSDFGNNGDWQYTQLAAPDNYAKQRSDGTCLRRKLATNQGIDFQFAYHGPWPADGSQHTATDSPGDTLSPEGYTQLAVDIAFHMYIMYKPPGADSIWVPLRSLSWQFSHCSVASADQTTWIIKDNNSQGGTWVDQTSHPTWTERAQDAVTDPALCPPPCSP